MGKLNRRARRLIFDVAIGIAALALFSVNITGLPAHEWVGLVFAVVAVAHIALSWDWVIGTSQRLARSLAGTVRLTWLVNLALFISMTLVVTSGIMISEVALPMSRSAGFGFWRVLHTQSSNASVVLVGLHLGLNWRWLVDTFRRHVLHHARPSAAPRGQETA